MSKRFAFHLLSLALLLLFGTEKANADAVLTSAVVNCSLFEATGTVTSAYVGVRIWNLTDGQFEGGPALIDSYFDVGAPTAYFPAPAGTFSFTVNFPAQTPGDSIVARVYGAPLPAFGSWDGGAFPQIEGTCGVTEVPTLSGWMLGLFALVLSAAGLSVAGRRRRV